VKLDDMYRPLYESTGQIEAETEWLINHAQEVGDQIRGAMSKFEGMSAIEIAQHLVDLGYEGKPRMSSECPLARYFTDQVGLHMSVDNGFVFPTYISSLSTRIGDYADTLMVNTRESTQIWSFTELFDEGVCQRDDDDITISDDLRESLSDSDRL
jgi:predicted component of type VI protein secretion system